MAMSKSPWPRCRAIEFDPYTTDMVDDQHRVGVYTRWKPRRDIVMSWRNF